MVAVQPPMSTLSFPELKSSTQSAPPCDGFSSISLMTTDEAVVAVESADRDMAKQIEISAIFKCKSS
jgi:hypothetical protein